MRSTPDGMRPINRTVYRLWHNLSAAGRVGYVGKDKRYPSRAVLSLRAKEKCCVKLYRALKKYPFKFWKSEVLEQGFRKDSSLSRAETRWIKAFDSKSKGYNSTDGGGLSGWTASAATRKKIGDAHRGKKLSAKTKVKLRRANLGKRASAATRLKLSKVRTGHKTSTTTRRKISLAKLGHTVSRKTRDKISKSLKRRKYALVVCICGR